MGCRYEWADDRHIIMNAYIESPWTWEEYNSLTEEMFNTLREQGTPCATAVEVNKLGRLPKGNALSNLTRMEQLMPDNVFASAIVGAPYIASVFMDILMRVRPRASRLAIFAQTMEEAHDKILKRYEELRALSGDKEA